MRRRNRWLAPSSFAGLDFSLEREALARYRSERT
jgi:hypothetical protein